MTPDLLCFYSHDSKFSVFLFLWPQILYFYSCDSKSSVSTLVTPNPLCFYSLVPLFRLHVPSASIVWHQLLYISTLMTPALLFFYSNDTHFFIPRPLCFTVWQCTFSRTTTVLSVIPCLKLSWSISSQRINLFVNLAAGNVWEYVSRDFLWAGTWWDDLTTQTA